MMAIADPEVGDIDDPKNVDEFMTLAERAVDVGDG
jgi:hypothetical protein